MELSILCDCDVALIIRNGNKVYRYASTNIVKLLNRNYEKIEFTNEDVSSKMKIILYRTNFKFL